MNKRSPQARKENMKARGKEFFLLFTGALLTLAFAPFHQAWLAFIAPAILLGCCLHASKKQALWYGWLFGLGFFGTSVSWVYISIHTFGDTNAFLAAFLTLLFVMFFALFTAFIGLVSNICIGNQRFNFWLTLFLFPLIWIASEWLRSWVGTGFPWVFLGYSQLDTPLRGYVPLIGIYGESYLTVLCAVFVYGMSRKEQLFRVASFWLIRLALLIALGAIFAGGYLLNKIHWTHPIDKPITVSLIQGNISQTVKWDEQNFINILQTYQRLTQPELGQNLIIWPEGAIPAPSHYVPDYLAMIDKMVRTNGSTLLLGTFVEEDPEHIYNGILSLGNDINTGYEKRHLVPFGEFVPFSKLLHGLINFFNLPMSDLSKGAPDQPLIKVGQLTISASICYEIAYPSLIWHQVSAANLLLNVSDDSWFDDSIASPQQLQISQMRALETGRQMLVSNNNGITALIDAQGNVVARLPMDEEGILRVMAQGYEGETPLVKLYQMF